MSLMSSNAKRLCPVCGCDQTVAVSQILHPSPALVAGVALDLGNVEFSLRSCGRCGFQFKDPAIEPEKLLACYAAADSDKWGESPDPWRRKFDVLRSCIERHARGKRILDVGCFNGALLKYLGPEWQLFGIEPSTAAAELARSRGVDVVASTIEQVDPAIDKFDVILAIDVVEHLVDPAPFFRAVANLLRPGGTFVVETGDTDGLAWRWQQGAYWYCTLPEHVSFYNRRSMKCLGDANGLETAEYLNLRPRRFPLAKTASDQAKNFIYSVGRATRAFGVPALRRWFVDRQGPNVQTAKDHLIYVYRRPSE
jgi:SAM-dependent methyltransferase